MGPRGCQQHADRHLGAQPQSGRPLPGVPSSRGIKQHRPIGLRLAAGVIDQGLRAYMLRVYNYMASGVAITGIVAYAVYAMSVVTGADGAITGLTPFGNFMFASAFFTPSRSAAPSSRVALSSSSSRAEQRS